MKLDGQRLLQLTKELVAIKSVVGTPEESNVSIKIEEILRSLPYFKKHPEKIFLVENEEDPLGRQSLMVSLEGQKEESKTTVVLIGHIDTVGISDYGDLSPYATNPPLLMEKLKER
ncbi:MAG TPA: peptidase M20, partial [Clostridiaceae bacterium]|nr:peptidase M20 [Clostridiaceae bacterium]